MKYKIIASIIVIVVLVTLWALTTNDSEEVTPELENVEMQINQ